MWNALCIEYFHLLGALFVDDWGAHTGDNVKWTRDLFQYISQGSGNTAFPENMAVFVLCDYGFTGDRYNDRCYGVNRMLPERLSKGWPENLRLAANLPSDENRPNLQLLNLHNSFDIKRRYPLPGIFRPFLSIHPPRHQRPNLNLPVHLQIQNLASIIADKPLHKIEGTIVRYLLPEIQHPDRDTVSQPAIVGLESGCRVLDGLYHWVLSVGVGMECVAVCCGVSVLGNL
jgi:hypothetical protein